MGLIAHPALCRSDCWSRAQPTRDAPSLRPAHRPTGDLAQPQRANCPPFALELGHDCARALIGQDLRHESMQSLVAMRPGEPCSPDPKLVSGETAGHCLGLPRTATRGWGS